MTRSDPEFVPLNAEETWRRLNAAGFAVFKDDIKLEARDERWLVHMPAGRLAWFPASEAGRLRLANERQTLKALTRRCSFRVPKVIFENQDGWDVREIVPGHIDPWIVLARIRQDPAYARRIGEMTAAVLIEQHTRIGRADLARDLPDRPLWPETRAWVMERLPEVIDDTGLIRRIDRLYDECERIETAPIDQVLVHGDLGLHNRAYDPDTLLPRGIFDYDSACWGDRHLDFRYTIVGADGEPVFETAVEIYEAALDLHLDRRRIFLHNALCAASFLAFRRGVAPETNWCGRTLSGDLEWVADAIGRLDD